MDNEIALKEELEDKIRYQALEITALKDENKGLKESVIIAQKQNNESLSLKEIIAVLPGNIFWKDREGRYLGCNNNIAKICNLTSPDDIIGKSDQDIFDS